MAKYLQRPATFLLLLALALLATSDATTAQTAATTGGGGAIGNRIHHAIALEQGTITITAPAQSTDQPDFFIRLFEQVVLATLDSINQGIGTLGNGFGLSNLATTNLGTTNLLGTST